MHLSNSVPSIKNWSTSGIQTGPSFVKWKTFSDRENHLLLKTSIKKKMNNNSEFKHSHIICHVLWWYMIHWSTWIEIESIKMFHRLIDVLSMKPVHSFHMVHLPRAKTPLKCEPCYSQSTLSSTKDMTLKQHKPGSLQGVSLVTYTTAVFLGVELDFTANLFCPSA